LVILGATTPLSAQTPHTPKPGSPERQAICDAMRAFVQSEHAEKTLPKPVVFKIDTLRVQGDFAYLECLPLFSAGTDAVSRLALPMNPIGLTTARPLPYLTPTPAGEPLIA
jgi:hypothetical protein